MTKSVPKFLTILLFIILVNTLQIRVLGAQDLSFEDFKKQYSATYKNYQDSVNQAFEGFLKAAWIEINAQKPVATYKEAKPSTIPIAKPIPEEFIKKPLPKKEKPKANTSVNTKPPVELSPLSPKAPVTEPPSSIYGLVFFGKFWEISFIDNPDGTNTGKTENYNDAYFREQWKLLKKVYNSEKQAELLSLLENQKASDWSTFLFVQQWINEQKSIPTKARDLHLWFVMQQLGYDFRIGYNRDESLVLAAFSQPLYGISYYNFADKKYYVVQNTQNITGRVKTYDGSIGKQIEWQQQIPYTALDGTEKINRVLKFPYDGKNHEISLAISPSHIAFQEKILRSKPELYGSFNPSQSVIAQLDKAIKPSVFTLSQADKVNYLLALVQYSFAYQTDDEQFGYEKFMTPEECLWNLASDCEDRTALFAWLINRYTKINYAFVRYPTHIALAVKAADLALNGNNMDTYKSANKKEIYIVADPTYIGASLGMEMPKLLNKGTLIPIQ